MFILKKLKKKLLPFKASEEYKERSTHLRKILEKEENYQKEIQQGQHQIIPLLEKKKIEQLFTLIIGPNPVVDKRTSHISNHLRVLINLLLEIKGYLPGICPLGLLLHYGTTGRQHFFPRDEYVQQYDYGVPVNNRYEPLNREGPRFQQSHGPIDLGQEGGPRISSLEDRKYLIMILITTTINKVLESIILETSIDNTPVIGQGLFPISGTGSQLSEYEG